MRFPVPRVVGALALLLTSPQQQQRREMYLISIPMHKTSIGAFFTDTTQGGGYFISVIIQYWPA